MDLPEHWKRIRLVIIKPTGAGERNSMSEIIEGLFHTFQKLGCVVDIANNEFILTGTNIVFFSFFIADINAIPPNSIIFNSEQINSDSRMVLNPLYEQLNRFIFWDYSDRNIEKLRIIAPNASILKINIGYVEELERIKTLNEEEKDIDFLFYGAINERRKKILNELSSHGCNVYATQSAFGVERDNLISRSKIVLNIHYYETKIFEIVRVSYLLNNKIMVISECEPDTEIDEYIKSCILCSPYDNLVNSCLNILNDHIKIGEYAYFGFKMFKNRTQLNILKQIMANLI